MSSSSRSIIQRVTPYLAARIRQNHRLLSSRNSSSAAISEPQPSSSPPEAIHMTDNFVRRMKELQEEEEAKEKMLRLRIDAGGCSGFQYNFTLDDDTTNSDDRIFEREGVKLVVDKISFDFVKGATVDYAEELIRSAFQVASNPSAVGGCSCKSSFMV